MTGSSVIDMTSTSNMAAGTDGTSPLHGHPFFGLFDINGNDDFCDEAASGASGQAEARQGPAHCHGRGRWQILCSETVSVNEDAVSDEDLLAVLLSYLNSANPRDLATQLITRFETFGNVVSARETQIIDAAPVGSDIVDFFRVIRAAGTRMAREEISNRPLLDEWEKLLTYLRTVMAHERVEQLRVLFLDRRNVLIADEVQHRGTIDHTPLYPREVVRRALELDASAIIIVHNHPSNHPAPSKPDIAMTRVVRDALERLGIVLHDHIIVSRRGHTSFRRMGLLDAQCA